MSLLLCALRATPVAAQGTGSRFGVGIGRNITTGAFRSDTTGEGFAGAWLITGHAVLRAPSLLRSERLRLRIDATIARHGANDQLKADLTNAFGQSADEHVTLIGLDANVAYPFARASRFAPSVFGGVGVWHSTVSVSVGGASTHTSATKLAWQVGGEVAPGRVFVELRYVMVAAA